MSERRRRILRQLLIGLALVEIVLPLTLFLMRNKIIFFPRNNVPPASRLTAFPRRVTAEVVTIVPARHQQLVRSAKQNARGNVDGRASQNVGSRLPAVNRVAGDRYRSLP